MAVRQKPLRLPVVQRKHLANLPLGKPARAVFFNGSVF